MLAGTLVRWKLPAQVVASTHPREVAHDGAPGLLLSLLFLAGNVVVIVVLGIDAGALTARGLALDHCSSWLVLPSRRCSHNAVSASASWPRQVLGCAPLPYDCAPSSHHMVSRGDSWQAHGTHSTMRLANSQRPPEKGEPCRPFDYSCN